MKKLFLTLVVVVLMSGLILGGCAEPAPAPAPAPAPTPAPAPPWDRRPPSASSRRVTPWEPDRNRVGISVRGFRRRTGR